MLVPSATAATVMIIGTVCTSVTPPRSSVVAETDRVMF